ncbi:hypothetical protein CEXT_762201 [Caerostris extrusa]|uniref:Uncharacterized protein n=1 Tax=Caerostris extrusa TaxID=172846 RepID=A0AAV4NWV6_CAEEX|nr:hypothetical protein CEXT_762201 [Caerostris extrusa]
MTPYHPLCKWVAFPKTNATEDSNNFSLSLSTVLSVREKRPDWRDKGIWRLCGLFSSLYFVPKLGLQHIIYNSPSCWHCYVLDITYVHQRHSVGQYGRQKCGIRGLKG